MTTYTREDQKITVATHDRKASSHYSFIHNFFYVNGNIFFQFKSAKIDFLTTQYRTSRSLKIIMTALNTIINKYNGRSFEIIDFHGDNEFNKAALKYFLQPALVHIYGKAEHVGPIERSIRTIKERCRSTCNEIPYKRIVNH